LDLIGVSGCPYGHTLEEIAKAQFVADGFGLVEVSGATGPASAHQKVEGQGLREDVILVKLRRCHHAPPLYRLNPIA
jgi:hypothetical protein